MTSIVVSIVDDENPSDKAEASVDAGVLKKCASRDEIRRVVGNLFLKLCDTVLENEPGDGEQIALDKTIKTKL